MMKLMDARLIDKATAAVFALSYVVSLPLATSTAITGFDLALATSAALWIVGVEAFLL